MSAVVKPARTLERLDTDGLVFEAAQDPAVFEVGGGPAARHVTTERMAPACQSAFHAPGHPH